MTTITKEIFEITPTDINDDSDKILVVINKFDKYVKDSDILVRWAHNGIGAYEFWGARGYDRGELQIEEIEQDELELRISGNLSAIEKYEFAKEVVSNAPRKDPQSDDCDEWLYLKIYNRNTRFEGTTLVCDLIWDEMK